MHTILTVANMDVGSETEIANRVTDFDAHSKPSKLVRRQLFHYHGDLCLHLRDYEDANSARIHDESDALQSQIAEHLSAFDAAGTDTWWNEGAVNHYVWEAGAIDAGTHSTVVVNRLEPDLWPTVVELFAEFDTTDIPLRMGTRRRQLLEYHGVYFHIQDFDEADGGGIIDSAWRTADSRFIGICDALDPLIEKYDTETWRRPADAVATRFYHWERV